MSAKGCQPTAGFCVGNPFPSLRVIISKICRRSATLCRLCPAIFCRIGVPTVAHRSNCSMPKNRKQKKQPQKRVNLTGWLTSDADEIERRRLRAANESFPLAPKLCFSVNIARGFQRYRVRIREAELPESVPKQSLGARAYHVSPRCRYSSSPLYPRGCRKSHS